MIEGLFTKAFRTGLQPVELATRILKEMEANKTVGVRQIWVPNHYMMRLAAPDRERFSHTEKVLRRELEQVIRDGAAERGWDLVGPPRVDFETDESLDQGEFRCETWLLEGPTTGAHAVSTPSGPAEASASPVAELVLLEDGKPDRAFPLTRDRSVVGRHADSDVVLNDAGASRTHAEVRRRGNEFLLADLGSTNGTRVNGAAIQERTLEEGDQITIGRTVLQFRRR